MRRRPYPKHQRCQGSRGAPIGVPPSWMELPRLDTHGCPHCIRRRRTAGNRLSAHLTTPASCGGGWLRPCHRCQLPPANRTASSQTRYPGATGSAQDNRLPRETVWRSSYSGNPSLAAGIQPSREGISGRPPSQRLLRRRIRCAPDTGIHPLIAVSSLSDNCLPWETASVSHATYADCAAPQVRRAAASASARCRNATSSEAGGTPSSAAWARMSLTTWRR